MDDNIVPVLRDWGTRDLESRIVETLLRDAADEIERLRELGDAMASVMRSGSDTGWDNAIDAWQEARRD